MTPVTPSTRVTRLWTLAAMAASLYYFTWLLQPGHSGIIALFVLMAAADLFNGFHGLSFWLTCLRKPRVRQFRLPTKERVDVLIPTVNEPLEIVERTVVAASAMTGASVRVLLLDDGGRPEVASLARRCGVDYLARAGRHGAKAGNLNHALRETVESGAPYVCVFDCDHVPDRAFLVRTLGFFVEPEVALVQTPQVYGNRSLGPLTRGAAEQQAIFFGPICAGRDGFGASFCCGTNFVVRREVLQEADGFPEDSITEDIVLSAKIAALGYEIAYVREPLSEGLGPEDARSYASQQLRWGTGCLDLLFKRRALWRPLSWAQRWQYFVATSYWLTGWTILIYMSLPVLRLLFGWQPIDDYASPEFAVHFLPYFVVSVINLGRYTSGNYTVSGLVMNWGSFAIHVRATLRALFGGRGGFRVTPKRGSSNIGWRLLLPNLGAVALIAVAAVIGLAEARTHAVFNNVAFAVCNACLVGSIVLFSWVQARAVAARETLPERAVRLAAVPAPAASTQPVPALAMSSLNGNRAKAVATLDFEACVGEAYDGEFRFMVDTDMRYGNLRATKNGLSQLGDYCTEHRNYWCGCKPEQLDPVVRAERQRRRHLPLLGAR
jgi:cellulose synthase (UDP-forming)